MATNWQEIALKIGQRICLKNCLVHIVRNSIWLKKNRASDNEGKFHSFWCVESEFFVKNLFHNWTSKLGCIWHIFGKLGYFWLFLSSRVQAGYCQCWNLPSLSLALFFFNHIEFWTLCLLRCQNSLRQTTNETMHFQAWKKKYQSILCRSFPILDTSLWEQASPAS